MAAIKASNAGQKIYLEGEAINCDKQRFNENYEMIKPFLQISREDYERAVSAPRWRRIKWMVYLGIISVIGGLAVYIDGDFHSFWEGVLGSAPICYVASKIMKVLE